MFSGMRVLGRKRVKVELPGSDGSAQIVSLSQKDEDGLHPFAISWNWKPIKGDAEAKITLCAEEFDARTQGVIASRGGDTPFDPFIHTTFGEFFPWAVEAFGVALKTECLDKRVSEETASYNRLAIGRFFRFCLSQQIPIDGPADLTYTLICQYRAYLRDVDLNSQYKRSQFQYVTRTLKRLMGTRYLPKGFSIPKYTADTGETLPVYSDAVMHQFVAACVSDIDMVMRRAKEFKALIPACYGPNAEVGSATSYSLEKIVRKFIERLSVRSASSTNQINSDARKHFNSNYIHHFRQNNENFVSQIPSVLAETDQDGKLVGGRVTDLLEREVATPKTLLPFYLLFMIYTGRNKETVDSWKRRYKVNNQWISPLEWTDSLDPEKCKVRGTKSRGKGRGKIQIDDVHIKKSVVGLYPLLEFLIWYTDPLARSGKTDESDSLWLVLDRHYETGTLTRKSSSFFIRTVNEFLERHQIVEFVPKQGGGFTKEPLSGLDTRRFRKNFAVREMMDALANCSNHQELADTLSNSLKHASFDTTLGSYLSHDTTMASRDIGIFTLQSEMLDTAMRFRGSLNDESVPRSGEPVILARCADPTSPDFELASRDSEGHCSEYDMCLGCTKSRVFEEHLPRIALRTIQYEEKMNEMTRTAWDADYGRKHARASDVLERWSDQEAVNEAWDSARSGKIILPEIIAKG